MSFGGSGATALSGAEPLGGQGVGTPSAPLMPGSSAWASTTLLQIDTKAPVRTRRRMMVEYVSAPWRRQPRSYGGISIRACRMKGKMDSITMVYPLERVRGVVLAQGR